MFDFKQLLSITPFPQKTKDELLSKADTLSEFQKKEIEKICWDLITQEHQNKIMLAKPVEIGESKASDEDSFKAIEEHFFAELAKKLNAANDTDKLAQLRGKIQSAPTSNQTTQ